MNAVWLWHLCLRLCNKSSGLLITAWGSQSSCQHVSWVATHSFFFVTEVVEQSYTYEVAVSQPSQKSLCVKEMESLRFLWCSFIWSPWQMNSLMIDLDWTCMKKPFIYSWNLICPVLWSDAFDKKEQNGKNPIVQEREAFFLLLLMPFSPSDLQFYGTKN